MTSWIYRPDHPQANENGMVDRSLINSEGVDPRVYVISDIMEPTRHMATGRMHTSKSEFRRDTKASGCVEVGNDPSLEPKERKWIAPDRRERREDIRRAIHELRNGNKTAIWR